MATAIDNKIKFFLEKWAKQAESQMKQLLLKGRKGNSRFYSMLRLTVKISPNGDISVTNNLPSYAIFVNDGRRPGKQPPIKTIEDWCKRKGIKKEYAYSIAKAIGKKGIKPTPFLTPMKDLRVLVMGLSKKFKESIEEELEDLIEPIIIKVQ